MKTISVSWEHMRCGCYPDPDYGLNVCPMHINAEKLLHGCQMAVKEVGLSQTTKEYLQAVLERVTDG